MMEKARAGANATHRANAARTMLAGKGGEGERPVQARLSSFHHYAVTGVKAQAFVLCLFHQGAAYRDLCQ